MSKLTRYLYDKNAVRLSLLNAILKKDNNRSLFWFFELYYSKLYDESVSLIYRIFCLFYLTTNFNFTKILNTNISLWRQTNDIKPLADIIYNLTLLNKDHRSTQPFIILQTINKNNNKIILYRGRKPKWCANFPTKYLQILQSINKRHYQNIYYYSKYLIDSELFQIIVQYFDIVENKTVGEIDSLLEILDATDAFSAIILTLCIANHSSSDSTDTLQLYSCDEELIDAIYENNCLTWKKLSETSTSFIKNSQTLFDKPVVETLQFEFPNEEDQHIEHNRILQNFTNFLLGKEDLYVPGDQGLNSVELINTMILSGLDKKEIELPLNEEMYENKLKKIIGDN